NFMAHLTGQRRSISRIISSAHRIASLIAAMVAGTRLLPSYCESFRAARIAAAIKSTRLRPSSTNASLASSLFLRYNPILVVDWKSAKLHVPDWVRSILTDFENKTEPHSEGQIADALRRAENDHQEMSPEDFKGYHAEWATFLFRGRETDNH